MKAFWDTYDLNNGEQLDRLMRGVAETHAALQALEMKEVEPTEDAFNGAVRFFNLIGAYADYAEICGQRFRVTSYDTVIVDGRFWILPKGRIKGREIASLPFGLLGPQTDPAVGWPSHTAVLAKLKKAWPGAVMTFSTGTSSDGRAGVRHVSIRAGFMQPKAYKGFPVESGSACCKDTSLAIMLAFVRLIAQRVVAEKVLAFARSNDELERRHSNARYWKAMAHSLMYSGEAKVAVR